MADAQADSNIRLCYFGGFNIPYSHFKHQALTLLTLHFNTANTDQTWPMHRLIRIFDVSVYAILAASTFRTPISNINAVKTPFGTVFESVLFSEQSFHDSRIPLKLTCKIIYIFRKRK